MSTQTSTEGCSGDKPISNVLVLRKRTYLEQVTLANDRLVLDLIDRGDSSVANIVPADREHQDSLKLVLDKFAALGWNCTAVYRDNFAETLAAKPWDMVATVGGDGTLIDATHAVNSNIPILGINSAPSTSHGHFCVAQRDNLDAVLAQIVSGQRKPLALLRLKATLNGAVLPELTFDSLFIGHSEVGVASHYQLKLGHQETVQRSDGLFVGTASGSTGWMRSYDCQILPIESRAMQFLSRGTIIQQASDRNLLRGVIHDNEGITLVSRMRDGVILIDGKFIRYPFERGSVVTIQPANQDLQLFIDPDVNEKYKALVPS